MKKCSNCGAKLLDEAAFCSHCGTACEEDMATQLLEEDEATELLEEKDLQQTNITSSEAEDENTALLDEEMLENSSPDMEENTTVLEEKSSKPSAETGKKVGMDEIQKNIEKKTEYRNGLDTAKSVETQKETSLASEEQNKPKYKKKVIALIVIGIVIVIIGISIIGSLRLNEALSNTDEENTTVEAFDGTRGDYKGLHWEQSSYLDGKKTVNYVEISGSGKLDEDFINNNINLLETEQIIIEGNIDICSNFGEYVIDKVKTIEIGENVEHIGFGALSGFSKLKTVLVFNRNLKIDFEEDDGLYETLGPSTSKVKIACYKGSTAEKYVKTWNENTDSNYVLSHIEE